MSLRYSSAFALASSLVLTLACSAPSNPSTTRRPGDTSGGGAGQVIGNGGSGNVLDVGNVDTGGATVADPNDMRNIPIRDKVCDADGRCTCLKLALLGTLTSAAADPDTTAFTTWLASSSEGTAVATNVPTKPPAVDAAFLAKYDILLVANVNGWTFSPAEKTAVETWVKAGGGIITLTGFTSTATEAAATSQLISFAGLNYSGTSEAQFAAPAAGEQQPVYYKGGSVDLKLCMDWSGTTTGVEHAKPFITTPLKFTPQTGTLEKLTANLDYVGAFIGWRITVPMDGSATVLAKDPVTGGNMAVAKEVEGKGRIFAFGDEWVTFTNEWEQTGHCNNQQLCSVPASGSAMEFVHSVKTLYQTRQFWYNAINWVAPPNSCFMLKDPEVITVK